MCLAVPLQLTEVSGANGVGEFDGVFRRIRLDFVPQAQVGDFVLVHAGFAIELIEKQQALANREAYREVTHAFD